MQTDPTAAELDAICARLTKAQLEALVKAELDGHLGRYFSRFISVAERRGLVKARLGIAVFFGVMLTPLGVATRKRLIERMNG